MEIPPSFHAVNWTNDNTDVFWNFYSQRPGVEYFSEQSGKELLTKFRRQIAAASSILDYGCGTGGFIEKLLGTGRHIAGFDNSGEAAAAVTKRFSSSPNFMGVITPERIFEFRAAFDLIFLLEVIEHVREEQRPAVLATIMKLLKPGGRLIVTTPNDENLEAGMVCCPDCRAVFHRWQHVCSWTEKTLPDALRQAGFAIEDAHAFDVWLCKPDLWTLIRRIKVKLTRRKPDSLVVIATRPS
jgi:2-polyprenyl-3-methyl-5-hydroxy-6-metoxy-1,4-benzoquinol methylase